MAQKNIDSEIPSALLHRLPRYYRALRQLIAGDILRVRSTELARLLGTGASQIRQDLHYFGEFGQKGYGYNVKDLYSRMGELLGVNRNYSVAIWGENGSGIMLAGFPVLKQRGVCVRFVADSVAAPRDFAYPVIREEELAERCASNGIDIVVFCVGRDRLEERLRILEKLRPAGVWNLTGHAFSLSGVTVHELCPADDFMALCCDIYQKQKSEVSTVETALEPKKRND